MGSLQELEKRMDTAEGAIEGVRILAAGASEDVSEYMAALKGHTSGLNALRKTQLEQSKLLEKQGSVLEKQTSVLAAQSSVLEKVFAELKTMREAQFQQSVDNRTLRDTQTRHYVDYQQNFTAIKVGVERVERLLKRSGDESGKDES